jgi:hypothetical protein
MSYMLTKSMFMAWLQSPKRLWLEFHEALPPSAIVPGPVFEGPRGRLLRCSGGYLGMVVLRRLLAGE